MVVSTCCQTDEYILLGRHLAALKTLSSNKNIIALPSDEGVGAFVMDSSVYNQKLLKLHNDNNTYEQISPLIIFKNGNSFKKFHKILVSEENKFWFSLINYFPTIPKMYGLPKIQKPEILLRPIIFDKWSVLYNIGKFLAKSLSPVLCSISDVDINNSDSSKN